MKICIECKKSKPLSEFYFRKDSQKYRNKCKNCVKTRVRKYLKINKKKTNQKRAEKRKRYPWIYVLKGIKQRCRNLKATGYKYYGAKGIKCLITVDEIKQLWFRDKAYLLNQPSIDREDNDGNYEYENCKFIEFGENAAKDKRKAILQFDLNNNFMKKWKSQMSASIKLNINNSLIAMCCRKERKTGGGFIWRFAT